MSKKHITRFSLDLDNVPPLTAKQHAMLDALEKMPDSEIDLSDIPEHTFMYKPVKEVTTIRLDADVLSWLRISPYFHPLESRHRHKNPTQKIFSTISSLYIKS